MTVASENALRAWVNARTDLVGEGNPLSRGAYLRSQRSPADGAYVLLFREMGAAGGDVCAEPGGPSVSRITGHCYSGTIESAETAAVALAKAWQSLTGIPEPCGDTGIIVLSAGNHADPGYIAVPGEGGEQFAFTVSADFLLIADD